MNEAVFRIEMILTVLAVLVVSAITPALAHVDVYFSPEPSTLDLDIGENVTLQVIADVDANETGLGHFQVGIDFNPNVVNITKIENPCKVWIGPPYNMCYEHWWEPTFGYAWYDGGPYGQWIWITAVDDPGYDAPVTAPLMNLTIERVAPGDMYLDISPREFTHERRFGSSGGKSELFGKPYGRIPESNISWHNTFERKLYAGWNLISLPFKPEDNSTSSVLASVWDNVSGPVYKYNAATKQFESVTTMDPGVGYFVYLTSDDYWVYNGTEKYDEMNIWLEPGLNMIGWLNCSKSISDALSSIVGNYNYVARWNASLQEFEVYVPGAPFNDFNTMEQGKGYFISAKEGCPPLTESCGA